MVVYLTLQIRDDGKLPRTICPGCNIQLQAMVQFMELVVTGQEKLRELLKLQNEYLRTKSKDKNILTDGLFNSELETFTIQAVEEDGKEILIQSNFETCDAANFITVSIFSHARWVVVFGRPRAEFEGGRSRTAEAEAGTSAETATDRSRRRNEEG